jgi:3-hydroxy-9,10-secoandrosta-1,3,5(10)-triene-9,17-dione monooxygenase reductase component
MAKQDQPAVLDTRAFRTALGHFATGVTIITTADAAGNPAGLTANSFNSVSLDPPMVLFSLALSSTSLDAFRQATWWAVHVLAAGQEALSNRFAQRDADKFNGVATSPGPGGIPLLDAFAARFICRAAFEYEGGDHAIFLGEVREFDQADQPPLIYHRGQYGGVLTRNPAPSQTDTGASAAPDYLARNGLADANGLTVHGRSITSALSSLARSTQRFSAEELALLEQVLGRL